MDTSNKDNEIKILNKQNLQLQAEIEAYKKQILESDAAKRTYESLVENLPQSVFQKDLDGKFIFANSNFCNSLKKELDVIIGKTDYDFYPKKLAEKYINDDKKVISTGEIFEDIEENISSNGHKIFVHVLKTPIYDINKKIKGIQCVFWDVQKFSLMIQEYEENEKRLMAQLIQTEKLSSIGLLGAGVAHELNSPLSGILTFLRLRRKNVTDNKKELEKFNLAIEAAERMAKIVSDLTAFSRGSNHEFTELNMNEIIDSTLSFSSQLLTKKGVKIIKNYSSDLYKILGDKVKLQQVVLNIMTNARKALSENGKLIITTYNADKNVIVEFADTGHGIKEEDLELIFDPFFTTRLDSGGTGLGLYVSKGIISNHKGNITVESTLGKGTKFSILLPALNIRN